jgi:hypothetical protein
LFFMEVEIGSLRRTKGTVFAPTHRLAAARHEWPLVNVYRQRSRRLTKRRSDPLRLMGERRTDRPGAEAGDVRLEQQVLKVSRSHLDIISAIVHIHKVPVAIESTPILGPGMHDDAARGA